MDEAAKSISRLLKDWKAGDPTAAAEVWSATYEELRAVARGRLAALPPGASWCSVALVHEAWRRVDVDDACVEREGRRAFFFAAARAMRDALVEAARARAAVKRGGGRRPADLDAIDVPESAPSELLVDVGDALARLGEIDEESRRIVELRFFAGLDVAETAEVCGVSPSTVERRWRFARAWLREALM